MKGLSKFDYGTFYGFDDRYFAVSKQRFSLDEAWALFEREWDVREEDKEYYAARTGAVRWRAGVNEDGEPCVGWWLEGDCDGSEPRCCPVWYFDWDWARCRNATQS